MTNYEYYKKEGFILIAAKIVFDYLLQEYPQREVGEIAKTTSGGTPARNNSSYYGGSVPWIKSGELNNGIIESCEEYITEEGLKNSSAKLYPKGTLVLALYGATVGKVGILGFESASNQAVCAIFEDENVVLKDYLFWFFRQKRIEYIEQSFGGAQPNISQKIVINTSVPIPNKDVQQKVVDFLNQYSNDGTINENFIFTNAIEVIKSAGNMWVNVERVIQNCKEQNLFTEILRNNILQEAVQGKLVPQDPKAEPASLLLEDIKAEKEKLISEGKIKREKLLPEITGDEIPYDLPDGWQWVRLGNITRFLGGYAFKSDTYIEDSNNQVVRLGNVKNDCLLLNTNPVFIPDEIAEQSCDYEIKVNDILITMTGTRGKRDYFYTCKVSGDSIVDRRLYLNQRVGCLRSYPQVNIDLLTIFLKSYIILDSIFETETGTANQGNIGSTAIAQLLFPLPPREEQERIVTKVKQAMDLCEELEENIIQSQKDSGLLMQSILRNAFK